MKFFSKKLLVASLGWMLLQGSALADNDRPIDFNQLPQNAQLFIKNNFGNLKISHAEVEDNARNKTYEVKFVDGSSIEFNKKGEWTEIDCEKTAVPLRLIPHAIAKHVKKNWPNEVIVKIEKNRKQYEVELSSDIEITYNKKFEVVDIDR